jgi:hypothetical protein
MGYLQDNLNTIIGIIIVILILCLYYGYYFIQNMIQTEIKNFYIKTEKRRLIKEKLDNNKENILQQQNIELQNKLQEKLIEDNFLNFENFDNNNQNNENNEALDLENVSFVDPLKNKKSANINNDIVNQNLAERNFSL